ncbi:uncharacterized protein LOC134234305 [Saccostrea cucullata]|uniref:uncharacterized protein LOC134234305 n=1 Tax=Saccostrea cuccullata TaxID=36930 RepID=UPI002ED0AB19
MGAEWILLTFILVYNGQGLGEESTQGWINRGQIRCYVQKCAKDQVFRPCTKDSTKDTCVDCPEGYFLPDLIDTSKWTEPPECYRNDCDMCDPTDSVLDNPKECGNTQKAHCVCDRTKDYYGENDPGPVTSCTKKIGDLCHRKGVQLNQKGECEPCPPGTEKNRDDSSLCTQIETREIATTKQGTEILSKHTTANIQTNSSYTSSTIPHRTLPTSISDATVIGVTVGVVFVFLGLIVILIVYFCIKRRKNDKEKLDGENCCPLENPRDSTSEESTASSEVVLLLKKDKNIKHEETNGYPVKPMIAVKPMISVDETKTDEEEEFDYSLNVGGFVNATNDENVDSAERDRNTRPETGLDSLGYNATEVKAVHSHDETDLKVPVQIGSNGENLHRTNVKTVYSEETEVKQIGISPARRQDSDITNVKQSVSSDETPMKQIAIGHSRRMIDNDSTGIKPLVSSEETPLKEIGRDHFSRTTNKNGSDDETGVSPEATSLKENETPVKIPVAPVRYVQPVSSVFSPKHFQSRDGSVHNEVNVTQFSKANQRQQATVLSNQSNSVQPTVCKFTDHPESTDTMSGIASGKNDHKNTTNNDTLSHRRQQAEEINQEKSSSLEKQSSQARSEESNTVADSDLHTEKSEGHSHTKTASGGSVSEECLGSADYDEGESVELASSEINEISSNHQPKVMSSSGQSGVHPLNQYVPHQSHQSNLNQHVQSNGPQPDQSSQHQLYQPSQPQPDQPSHEQGVQSRLNEINNGVGVKSESSSVPIPSGTSRQTSGASYVQMSVQNSAATSGYGTAKIGTYSETANNSGHERSVDNTSSEPLVVNSVLRSDSRNAGDPLEEDKNKSNDSLGERGLNNAPSMNTESSDQIKPMEVIPVPVLIKREPGVAGGSLEGEIASSRQQLLNQAFVAQGGRRAESGYCS